MSGMHAATGKTIAAEIDHIWASVRCILVTPMGSRVMRRPFGSLIPDLIDHPDNPANRLRLIAASYMAIIRWEPRVRLTRASITTTADGKVSIDMECQRRSGPRSGSSINLSIPIR